MERTVSIAGDTRHAPGSDVWVRDAKDGWVKARVTKVGQKVHVLTEHGEERELEQSDCPLQNVDGRGGVEDMTELSHLHEPGVLWNLKKRYLNDDIYTYTGNILIAVNPFQQLSHLYGDHMMDMYKGQDLGELSPHVYASAEAAYRQMVAASKSQSILVSGESGAGKTETCKLIMKYLAFLGGYADGTAALGNAAGTGVETKVLESNPLLEAFGNAKTVRNDNSSRFGKFTEIQFDSRWRIVGAAIRTYLLERSRVVAVNDPERNYHVFYQLCAGASDSERAAFHLEGGAKSFSYLNRSSCYELPGVDNAAEYAVTRRAMTVVGISPQDQYAIFKVVAAVLHLGNCRFVEDPSDDGACVLPDAAAKEALAWAAQLLGVASDGLMHALSTRTRQTPDGPIVSPIRADAAVANRDALAKTIYARLFDYLVAQVNVSIGHVPDAKAVVGVLDIYGFEQFKINGFEQFCINLANEKLQQHFNQHVFKMEQAEYEAEEIDWTTIQFVDNQDVLDLIEKKPLGLLDTLDETCRFPQATGATFAEKMYGNPDIMQHARFEKPKRSNTAFLLEHYAGQVEYQVDSFLEKNKDFVVKEHQDLLGASSLPLISDALFKVDADASAAAAAAEAKGPRRGGGSSYKFVSVGSQFKKQLAALMATLSTMEPHYVRCIKPNPRNVPSELDNVMVLQQLRCGGVLEAVRISCAGYPSRRLFFDFVEHFWHLAPDLVRGEASDEETTMHVVTALLDDGYAKGRTKIFLKGGQMAVLERHRTALLNASAVTIQRYVRGHLQGNAYRVLRRNVVLLQSYARRAAAVREAQRRRWQRAALKVQAGWRGTLARRLRARHLDAARTIQAARRGQVARRLAKDRRAQLAATRIQRVYRGHVVRRDLSLAHRRATRVQCLWRSKVARRQLRALRAEARDSGKLKADKEALEVQLREMQGFVASMQASRDADKKRLVAAQAEARDLRQDVDRMRAELGSASAAALAEAHARVTGLEATNKDLDGLLAAERERVTHLQQSTAALERELADAREDLADKEERSKAEMNRLRSERERMRKENLRVNEDLMMRLKNACEQRDEAREQALGLQAALEAQRLDTEEKVKAASRAAVLSPGRGGKRSGAGEPETPPRQSAPSNTFGSPGEKPLLDSMNRMGEALTTRAYKMWSPGKGSGAMTAGAPVYGAASGEASELERRQAEMQHKQQVLAQEQQAANQASLVSAIQVPLGFHNGRPVAAMLIFRCCIQWKAFEMDRTTLFDRLVTTIGQQVEDAASKDNGRLCYWLTNTVTLLYLLQRNIKPAASGGRGRLSAAAAAASGSPGILARAGGALSSFMRAGTAGAGAGGLRGPGAMNHGEASIHGGGAGGFRQIAAKYPALLFKQQLDACMGKTFPMLRDNVKRDVQPSLAQCIHAPRTSHSSKRSASGRLPATLAPSGGSGPLPGSDALAPWHHLLAVLSSLREQLVANHVPPYLQGKLFQQLFSFINVNLFNQLLLRRECCSFANGEYVKNGLALVEEWVLAQGDDLGLGGSWEGLRYIRQAVSFLVLHQKQKKTLGEIRQNLCPELSVQQLYRISTMYWDDKYSTETVSQEVLQQMRREMQEHQGAASHSFLLDDDSSNPFSAQDVQLVMDDRHLYSELPVPECLAGNRNFDFLQRELKLTAAPAESQ